MPHNIEVKLPSAYLNILNFFVFDVALITLVYLLTEDVMGRMNDWTLRDGKPHRLFIICPPVLGGGLCSTSRLRALFFLLARLIGLCLILASGFAIEGKSRLEFFFVNRNIFVRGNLSTIADAETFQEKAILRSSCLDRRPPKASGVEGNATLYTYGELREVRTNGAPMCD